MRLGRKISEGYAVDHEADRAAVPAPPDVPVEPDRSGWAPAEREPAARAGSAEG